VGFALKHTGAGDKEEVGGTRGDGADVEFVGMAHVFYWSRVGHGEQVSESAVALGC
jgi:hypothetical protein